MNARLRRSALFAATAGLLGLLALSPARPVSALDRSDSDIRVGENETVEKEYGPLSMSSPVSNPPQPAPRLSTPENCKEAAYCDVVPLEIVVPPTLRPADEFFVTVSLDWKTDRVEGVTAGGNRYLEPQDVNDLDLYVWAATDPPPEEPVDYSAFTRPESVRLFRPTNGRYSIVVFNSMGPNHGYKLTVEYKPENIEPPFELLPPEFAPVATPQAPAEPPAAAAEPEAPARPIGVPAPARAPTVTPAPVAPVTAGASPLTPVVIEPDPDFTNFADDDFDEQLAAPTTDVLTEKQVRAVGPPEPASTVSLVFWLVIVPLLVVAAGGIWLSKKGSAVLKMR